MAWLRGMIEFNGINLTNKYGIVASKVTDVLTPQLRERKVAVPRRHGRYDYGAEHREERALIIECNIAKSLTRSQLRELSYDLSHKGKIRTWEEPDKYYVGQLYNPESILKIGQGHYQFTLEFTCEPFAYGSTITQALTNGNNTISYKGTAETPCLIVLKNTSETEVQTIQITAVYRR